VMSLKEKIYTIPVTDAFREDCECPFCALEDKLEAESLDFYLGGALMEPDYRIEMNEHGFCKTHLDALFNSKKNVLGLGLILTSFFNRYNERLSAQIERAIKKNDKSSLDDLKMFLAKSNADCTICNKLRNTMKRYISVFYHMWKTEKEFKAIFESKKGFCRKHFIMLLEDLDDSLKNKDKEQFLNVLFDMQLKNLNRLQSEVKWFTEKFDYQNNDKPWGNSRDAVQRCIEKLK